ncbi:MAG: hypothetical protein AAF666_07010 [Pseudomonadota bacterium]
MSTATGTGTGRLALWNDCAPGHLAAYDTWYLDEHLPERLSIPGFLRARRFVSTGEGPAFFTYYQTREPAVLTSEAYLERLNNPTPRTKIMMSDAFTNMSRTFCRVVASRGHVYGAWAMVLQMDRTADDLLPKLAMARGIARAEVWQAAADPVETTESRLRGGDDAIGACLLVETLRRGDADLLARQFAGALVYELMCEMTAADVPAPR